MKENNKRNKFNIENKMVKKGPYSELQCPGGGKRCLPWPETATSLQRGELNSRWPRVSSMASGHRVSTVKGKKLYHWLSLACLSLLRFFCVLASSMRVASSWEDAPIFTRVTTHKFCLPTFHDPDLMNVSGLKIGFSVGLPVVNIQTFRTQL